MAFSEENLKRIEFYERHYQIIVDYPLVARRQRLRDHVNDCERECRFCGKAKPEVSFKKVAHAIPEFIGNKSLVSMNECDICNEFFAHEYEDHLAKWFGPMRTLCQMQGKGGTPKYKSHSLTAEKGNTGMQLYVRADSSMVNVKERGSFKIPVPMPTQQYIPLRAAQALTKAAISVLPQELLSECKNTILWLSRGATVHIHKFPVLYAFTPGVDPYKQGKVMICKRKNPLAEMPFMWFVVETANFLFQIMIPFCKSDGWITQGKDNSFEAMPFPTPFSEEYEKQLGRTVWRCEDWASDKPTVQNREASFHVERIEEEKTEKRV